MQPQKALSPLDLTTEELIHAAIVEDVGTGDVTATYFVPEVSVARAVIVAREPGVMSGAEIAVRVFALMDARIEARALKSNGEAFVKGDVLREISGPTRAILTGERTALNFLQRLCGVATQTRRYVEAVKPYPVQVWDTRKTTPGWRLLEKAAVKAGGGTTCYAPGAWRTATSNDLASRSYVLGAGVVTDTTWATLNLRPATSSTLVSSLFPSGYAGAFDAAAAEPPADNGCTCPPDIYFVREDDL